MRTPADAGNIIVPARMERRENVGMANSGHETALAQEHGPAAQNLITYFDT
jgi:hypothetical protein